jgi:hypothetical protein
MKVCTWAVSGDQELLAGGSVGEPCAPQKSTRWLRHWLRTLFILLLGFVSARGQDGPPAEFGPTDPHVLAPTGLDQKVAVIYVQANDYRILPGDLAALNTTADQRRQKISPWFSETSWNGVTGTAPSLTVNMEPHRAGNQWYTLPGALLEYVRPGGVQPMQVRSPASATATAPTPPSSVTAAAAAAGSGGFTAGDAGNYFYAVAAFRNGVESQLMKTASVAVTAGQAVTLTINRATSDADRYLIYRTGQGATNADVNFSRIGQVDVTGSATPFVDPDIRMDALGDWAHIITDAMEAAHADIPDFDPYKGVLVVIFSPFLRGQAGSWIFTISGSQININAVYLGSEQDFGRYTHEMGHWIGLPDLYDPVTAGSIASWDTMDCACDGEYQTWEKDFLLHYLANPANVVEITRPIPGNPDLDQDFIINPTEVNDTFSNRVAAVKIRASDTVHYYIEGRRHIAGGTSDQNTPNQNILITEAIDVLPMGIIPRRNVKLLTSLNAGDPVFRPEPSGNVEITFTSTNPGPSESYNVHVKLKAQPQPDPAITPWGAPPWESPDIWVDSSREGGGFQDPATAVPLPGNGEHTWVNHENRVWAKITNRGDGPATNVHVKFKVNVPGGIGDAGQFVDLPDPAPFDLGPHESKMIFTTWTPTVAGHTCIKVEIDHIVGEADINNNFAQENITDFYTGSSSPWHEVPIPLDVANPFPETKRVDILVTNLPHGWRAKVANSWVTLDPKGRKFVQATIIPNPTDSECTKATLNVYGQTRIDDFIQPYSGFTPVIHLANPIQFRMSVENVGNTKEATGVSRSFRVRGCTLPAQPNSEIALQLELPGGPTHVVFTQTDAAGCFDKVVNFPTDGNWKVVAYFPGNACKAPTESQPTPVTVGTGGGGNGIPPRGAILFGASTGGNWPVGGMRTFFDPGFRFAANAEVQLTPNFRAGAEVGYHQFAQEPAKSPDNLGITNVSALARFSVPTPFSRAFVLGGPGLYYHGSAWNGGAQIGGGLEVSAASGVFLTVGTAFHGVGGAPRGQSLQWVDGYIGVSFRIR